MSGGGAGDRPGLLPSRASGDRHVRSSVRAARAHLLGLDLKRVATVTIVVGGDVPQIVMFAGEPFLLAIGGAATADLTYLQARAYRVDAVIDEVGA